MIPHLRPDPLGPEGPEHEPELQGAEPSSELDPPVPVVLHPSSFTRFQVFGKDIKGSDKRFRVLYIISRAVEIREHPLVGIEHEAVRFLYPIAHPAEFGEHQPGPCIGSIHMEPDVAPAANSSDLGKGIDSGGPCRSHGGHHRKGAESGFHVTNDRLFKLIWHHGKGIVHLHFPELFPSETCNLHILLDGGMGLRGAVDGHRAPFVQPLGVHPPVGEPFPGGEEGAQRCGGGGVLDHPGKALRESDELPGPFHDPFLELCCSRGGLPDHALGSQGCGEHLRKHRGVAVVGIEVRQELRMLPVSHSWEDEFLEIPEHHLEILSFLGGMLRKTA